MTTATDRPTDLAPSQQGMVGDPSGAQPASPAPASPQPHSRLRRRLEETLALADVRIGGDRAWDIRVNDWRILGRVARDGLLGLGDAYVEGDWDCDAIDEMFCRLLRHRAGERLPVTPRVLADYLSQRLLNRQLRPAARRDIATHYDRGNDLFEATLDPRMIYSCAYWGEMPHVPANLAAAQEAKLEVICRKIGLLPGQRVLDIGCGWGGFVRYAAEKHGAVCHGITLSREQLEYARRVCQGLPVTLELRDYRDLPARGEAFDHVVSVGMIEHVGPKNYRRLMSVVERVLSEEGLFLLHFFASPRSFPNLLDREVDWIERHIFPGMVIPSLAQIGAAIDGKLVLEDLENFGAWYDPTLMAWHDNFRRNWHDRPALRQRYGERFERIWRYYLLTAAGAFRARKYQLWQMVLSRKGVKGVYRRPVPPEPAAGT